MLSLKIICSLRKGIVFSLLKIKKSYDHCSKAQKKKETTVIIYLVLTKLSV